MRRWRPPVRDRILSDDFVKIVLCIGIQRLQQRFLRHKRGTVKSSDPHAIKEVKNLFYELKENECSLLISTHILDTVDDLWNRVEIMDHGKIAASMSHEELKATEKSLEKYFFEITEQGQFESR